MRTRYTPDTKYQMRDYRSVNPKTKTCAVCSTEFIPYTSLMKFCSAKCRIDNMKSTRSFHWSKEAISRRSGENNPAYKHGLRTSQKRMSGHGLRLFFRNRDAYKQAIIDEHGYLFCENCGATSCKFEAHHIIFRSEKPKHPNLHDKENILNLCVKCHNWYHEAKSNRNKVVMQRGLQLIFGDDILHKDKTLIYNNN